MSGTTFRWGLLAVGVALVGVSAAGLLYARNLRASSAELVETKAQLVSLRDRIDHVARSRPPTTMVVQAAATPPQAEPVAEASSEAPTTEASVGAQINDILRKLDPEERRHRISILREDRVQRAAEALSREPVDSKWSREAAASLQAAYQGEEFVGVTVVAECRSSLCKVSIESQDPSRGEEALRKAIEKTPWPTKSTSRFNRKDGTGTIYLAREGAQLPAMDPSVIAF